MIAIHGAFQSPDFLLWVEPAASKPLRSAAAAIGLTGRPPELEAIAWLPSFEGKPVPSSPLLGEGAYQKDAYLSPYPIPVLALTADQSIAVLAQAAGKHLASPGILISTDLAYWAAALRFAAGMVQRGHFLPGVSEPADGGVHAAWIPVIHPADEPRFHALVKAMPASARAVTPAESEHEPATPAETVLRSFLQFIVDQLVRGSASRTAARPTDSIHDRWISGLTQSKSLIAKPESLAAQVQQWQRPIQIAMDAPFRLCLRLNEPTGDDSANWIVEYLMQAKRDPSLLLSAAHIWDPKSKELPAKDKAVVRENLLASLGEAAAIDPRIQDSLKQKAPAGFSTTSPGAHEFLRQSAPALEQSGFGVILPSWWTRKGTAARLKARASLTSRPKFSRSMLGLEQIIEFDWQLALGDDHISEAQLRKLAAQKASLVQVRGQWVEVNSDDIARALRFLEKNPSGRMSARDAVRMALGAGGAQAGDMEVEGLSATGWIDDVLAQLQGRKPFAEQTPPAGMQATLRPYQIRGFSWLAFLRHTGLGACLADDMGLGKTIQTLALIQADREAGETRPVLLVCPMSVTGNWQREAARFTPQLPTVVHHGVTRAKGESFARQSANQAIVVTSYSLLHRDIEHFQKVDWAGVILDEAQNIKNSETKQARAARALKPAYKIALTGTPVENNIGDLWSVMEFLNPGFLGSHHSFHHKFFVPIQVYSDHYATERLKKITGPFILRRLKSDKSIIADLPEKMEMKVFCNLTREQATLYESVVRQTEELLKNKDMDAGISRQGLVLATLSKLKQVCNHPAQFLKDNSAIPNRSGKLARLSEMIEETLEAGDRSLIFTQFAEMGGILQRYLQETFGVEALFLHGGTPKKARDTMVQRFAEASGPRLFLLSLKAGGTGLNLTNANHVFHFDRWWNPAVENQATDRAYRIGQTRNVQVHKFVCAGTLEEKIDAMIERKSEIAGQVVGTGESWLTKLSNAELRDLLTLRRDAIGE